LGARGARYGKALDELVTELTRAGFDRSDIDLLASRDAVTQKLNAIYATPIDLENDLRMGGLVVFVRARNLEGEEKAQDVMRRCGAQHVHVHEIELKKTFKDVPLSDIRPDPWLGDEKLGS
jgi:hypothetical protein